MLISVQRIMVKFCWFIATLCLNKKGEHCKPSQMLSTGLAALCYGCFVANTGKSKKKLKKIC